MTRGSVAGASILVCIRSLRGHYPTGSKGQRRAIRGRYLSPLPASSPVVVFVSLSVGATVGVRCGGLLAPLLVARLTAAPASAADPVLVAAGDIACDPGRRRYIRRRRHGAAEPPPGSAIRTTPPTLIAGLGSDARARARRPPVRGRGAVEVQRLLRRILGPAGIKVRTKPVPGNHEYGAGNANDGNMHDDPNATGYFGYFQSQLAAEGPGRREPAEGLVQLRRAGRLDEVAHRGAQLRVRRGAEGAGRLGRRLRRRARSRSAGCAPTWPRTAATARSPTGTTRASAPAGS